MDISIRKATPDNASELVRVQIAAFEHDATIYPGVEPGGPPGYDSVADMLDKIADDECYVISLDGVCIGGIVVFDMGGGHFHLDVIFIDPAFHNLGIGTQAMAFIEQSYPATKWTLDTPQWAVRNQHFYEKLGYKKVRLFTAEDNTPLIAFEKKIVSQNG